MQIGRLLVTTDRYCLPISVFQIAMAPADLMSGVHLWFQFRHTVRSILIGFLPRHASTSVERPNVAGSMHATPPGRESRSSSPHEEQTGNTNPHAFWGGFGGAGEA